MSGTEEKEEDELQKALKEYTREELEAELYGFKRLWEVIDDETKYLLGSIGELFALVRRDYNRKLGTLLKVRFKPEAYTVGVYERIYDSAVQAKDPDATGYLWEMKESTILATMILSYEKIHRRDLEIEKETEG